MMKKIIFIIFLVFISQISNSWSCASFLADSKNLRSGGSVKHFFSTRDEKRNLIVKNETNKRCKIKLEVLDMIQRIDGSYRYVNFVPNRNINTSLASYLSVVSEEGDDILWNEITLAPKAVLKTRIGIQSEGLKEGTYFSAIRAYFPEEPTHLLLTELYYSHGEYHAPELILKNLKYDSSKQTVNYTLKGIGSFYSFIYMDIVLVDPITGFEVDGFKNSQGEFIPFRSYIRNYWNTGARGQRMISSKFSIKDFNRYFKIEYTKKYPDTDWQTKSWVISIRLRYGIDVDGWKNHYYLALPTKLIEIKNN